MLFINTLKTSSWSINKMNNNISFYYITLVFISFVFTLRNFILLN